MTAAICELVYRPAPESVYSQWEESRIMRCSKREASIPAWAVNCPLWYSQCARECQARLPAGAGPCITSGVPPYNGSSRHKGVDTRAGLIGPACPIHTGPLTLPPQVVDYGHHLWSQARFQQLFRGSSSPFIIHLCMVKLVPTCHVKVVLSCSKALPNLLPPILVQPIVVPIYVAIVRDEFLLGVLQRRSHGVCAEEVLLVSVNLCMNSWRGQALSASRAVEDVAGRIAAANTLKT